MIVNDRSIVHFAIGQVGVHGIASLCVFIISVSIWGLFEAYSVIMVMAVDLHA